MNRAQEVLAVVGSLAPWPVWASLAVLVLALIVIFYRSKRRDSGVVQWCPDCDEKLTVSGTRLRCPYCGFTETDPGMK